MVFSKRGEFPQQHNESLAGELERAEKVKVLHSNWIALTSRVVNGEPNFTEFITNINMVRSYHSICQSLICPNESQGVNKHI